MMAKRKILRYITATLFLIISLKLFVAATSILPAEGNKSVHRPSRQAKSCRSVSLDKKKNFWKQHNKNLSSQFTTIDASELVVVYAETSLGSTVTWVLQHVTDVLDYLQSKTKYALRFGNCLAVIIHQGKYPGDQHMYAIDESNILGPVNVLDIGTLTPNLWTDESKRNEAKDLLTNQLAYFVEFTSNGNLGSPSSHIWKSPSSQDSAFVEIFTYDVYMNVQELKGNAPRYTNKTLSKSQKTTFPKNETFWFRDWFLPIYENYGGTTVLSNYFNIIATYIPGIYYESNNPSKMTMGEFVHFWSGAARVDLAPLAWEVFGWNRALQKELNEAQEGHKFKDPKGYVVTSEKYNFTDTPEENGNGGNVSTKAEAGIGGQARIEGQAGDTIKGNGNDVLIGVSAGVVVLLLIIILVIFVIYHKRKVQNLQTEIRSLTSKEVRDFFEGDPNASTDEMMSLVNASPFIRDYEISKDRLVLGHTDILGSGEYGCVIRGFIRQLDSSELLPVAVKTVKPDVDVPQFKAILSEAKIMAYLGKHENIVLLCGTHTDNIKEREIYIALELCTLGDLKKYLRNNKEGFLINSLAEGQEGPSKQMMDLAVDKCPISVLNLFKWSHDISNAMVYLTEKKVIHGDLAARNILLTASRVAKVSDFGLSRQLLNYGSYMKTTKVPMPWRWMAIESLRDMEFSIASDVWAFGVTLWEIFSLGETPYPGATWDYDFADRITGGERLQAPPNANAPVYELMQDCWNVSPSERPSFQTIYNLLSNLVRQQADNARPNYIELESF